MTEQNSTTSREETNSVDMAGQPIDERLRAPLGEFEGSFQASQQNSSWESSYRGWKDRCIETLDRNPAIALGAAGVLGSIAAAAIARSLLKSPEPESTIAATAQKFGEGLHRTFDKVKELAYNLGQGSAEALDHGSSQVQATAKAAGQEASHLASELERSLKEFAVAAEKVGSANAERIGRVASNNPIISACAVAGAIAAVGFYAFGSKTRSAQGATTGRRGGKMIPYEDRSREELYERAKELDIPGRSSMSKQELIDALRTH